MLSIRAWDGPSAAITMLVKPAVLHIGKVDAARVLHDAADRRAASRSAAPERPYFFSQRLLAARHWPPAFSHSSCDLYCEKSPEVEGLAAGLVEGLADGDGDVPAPEGVPPLGLLAPGLFFGSALEPP
jgi:hypothetical protein